jgi:hypothetical protein
MIGIVGALAAGFKFGLAGPEFVRSGWDWDRSTGRDFLRGERGRRVPVVEDSKPNTSVFPS